MFANHDTSCAIVTLNWVKLLTGLRQEFILLYTTEVQKKKTKDERYG